MDNSWLVLLFAVLLVLPPLGVVYFVTRGKKTRKGDEAVRLTGQNKGESYFYGIKCKRRKRPSDGDVTVRGIFVTLMLYLDGQWDDKVIDEGVWGTYIAGRFILSGDSVRLLRERLALYVKNPGADVAQLAELAINDSFD